MTDTAKATKVGVISLGCAKNLVDSEVMLGHLARAGCTFVQDPAEADVILVNTCGFIEAAREESVETILEAAELKKTGRLKRLVVAGCMVQRYADELKNTLPEVDAFIGLDQLDRVVESAGVEPRKAVLTSDLPLLRPGKRAAGPTATAAWGPSTYLYDEHTPRSLATPAWTAYLKIAEGCDHTCAFCAIPSFRGLFRSRDLDSIRAEAEALSQRGVREVSLIAQDSSHYGRDIGLTEGLAALLTGLNDIEALRWIRLHYLYPNTITQKLIDTMAALPRVVDYVDLPLQHAHPATLKRMRRGGSGETHLKLLDRFRAAMPDGALRSTFIVGFPGETEDEFTALLEFVDAARFDHLGVFTYSHEESTPAYTTVDDVPTEVKESRRDRLMELQRGIATAANEGRVGRTVEVLVEGAHAETEHLLVGRTRGQALDVDGQVLINDGQAAAGSFVRVELTDVAGYDLVGRITGAA
ncbi:MAG: 30S ribosomal protein S12 methylthiotransferase RimO [Acidobacteria bacterium]|nr:30S ribosomal protein S12 methylthiotransferase RimO [Acidobacteriota bacterium]